MTKLDQIKALMRDIARTVKQLPEDEHDRVEAFLFSYLRLLENDVAEMHRKTLRAIERGLSR